MKGELRGDRAGGEESLGVSGCSEVSSKHDSTGDDDSSRSIVVRLGGGSSGGRMEKEGVYASV